MRAHSEKPDEFYALVKSLRPAPPQEATSKCSPARRGRARSPGATRHRGRSGQSTEAKQDIVLGLQTLARSIHTRGLRAMVDSGGDKPDYSMDAYVDRWVAATTEDERLAIVEELYRRQRKTEAAEERHAGTFDYSRIIKLNQVMPKHPKQRDRRVPGEGGPSTPTRKDRANVYRPTTNFTESEGRPRRVRTAISPRACGKHLPDWLKMIPGLVVLSTAALAYSSHERTGRGYNETFAALVLSMPAKFPTG